MKIFKFGGASVKDADGVRNVFDLLESVGHQNILIVVSAMGKITNAMEAIVENYFNKAGYLSQSIFVVKRHHIEILNNLFPNNNHEVYGEVKKLFEILDNFLVHNKSTNFSFVYDQIVSFGELLSTKIIAHYFIHQGLETEWVDARNCIKTDSYYRDANLDWETTSKTIKDNISKEKLVITQGFIGRDENNFTTTLGREGSDYSAAIFGYALNAESVTIWKDVPGVLNADPRHFDNTTLLHQISYREAIELAYYGASVIHPKTLQPLQRKEIPLYVKSFQNPTAEGTAVMKGKTLIPETPCFILKKQQVLLSLFSLDFSFIVEHNISAIFALLHQYQMRVELVQNSAISFSVCINNKYGRLEELVTALQARFRVEVSENVDLYTIRHFNREAIHRIKNYDRPILLEQRTQQTAQFVLI